MVANKLGVQPSELRGQVHTNVFETYGDRLQQQIQEAFKLRLQEASEERHRVLKLAREVERYDCLTFEDAMSSYRRGSEKFADGFSGLVDPVLNKAPDATDYREIIASAVDAAGVAAQPCAAADAVDRRRFSKPS